jgi:hypothetical protein
MQGVACRMPPCSRMRRTSSAPTAPAHRPLPPSQTRNLFGGVGGVFHGAIVLGDVEYSFGYCVSDFWGAAGGGSRRGRLRSRAIVGRRQRKAAAFGRQQQRHGALRVLARGGQVACANPGHPRHPQENGSGVYHVKAKTNPMYTYRETLSLGPTVLSNEEVRAAAGAAGTPWASLRGNRGRVGCRGWAGRGWIA